MEDLVRRVGEKGGCTVLVKDRVACSGSFLLHYLLKKLLSDTSMRVLLLGLSAPFTHYNRIARKQGCNLQVWRDRGRFAYLELNSEIFEASSLGWNPEMDSGEADLGAAAALQRNSAADPLASLYLKIRDATQTMPIPEHTRQGEEQTCIMIDDISVLDVVAGGSQNAVLDFLHYCRALSCGKQRCSVVLLTHQELYDEPADSYMGLELEYASDTVISVEPLNTGRATDVHGQLTMCHRIDQSLDNERNVAPELRLQTFQFRILENTVQFFIRGQQ